MDASRTVWEWRAEEAVRSIGLGAREMIVINENELG